MKVLMFCREFPHHTSGGLVTAYYGLSKGLTSIAGIEIQHYFENIKTERAFFKDIYPFTKKHK
jgi:hypothetical protein